jgi:hypothetical protein
LFETTVPPTNRIDLNIAYIIKYATPSATETELAALYSTARETMYIIIILEN